MGSGKKETTEEKELEGSDGMLPGTRDLMGGRKRLKQVGAEHFMEERTVKRTRRAIMMDAKLPFAELYNEKLDELLVVESRKMECKHQLRELRGREATEKNVRQIEAKKVRMELIEEDWMVVDDTLDLLQECSDHALTGQVASAWQVWENAQKEQKGDSKSAAFTKRKKAADVELKEKAKTDQATFMAMQLGVHSAMMGGQDGNLLKQAAARGGGGGRGQQQWAQQQQGQYQWGQQQQAQWQQQQQAPWGGAAMPRPMPPGPPPVPPQVPNPWGMGGGKGGGGKGGKGTFMTPTRIRFDKAENVFGHKCPGQLRGVLVPEPFQMRFGKRGKTLVDPARPPNPGMPVAPCKVCWKMPPQCAVAHEAYTCEEVFDVAGVPGKGYRELHRMGLLDATGEVI